MSLLTLLGYSALYGITAGLLFLFVLTLIDLWRGG